MKPSVLILCTGNSCHSHLAEGILQEFRRLREAIKKVFGAYAAGLREGRGLPG